MVAQKVIVYLDTSAMVKLFVEEEGSEVVRALVEGSVGAVTASVAYAEARAAFARKRRDTYLTSAQLRRVVTELDMQWESYGVVDLDMVLVRAAGGLAEQHGLRGYDAIHLAAALSVRDRSEEALMFCAADGQLAAAAQAETLKVTRV